MNKSRAGQRVAKRNVSELGGRPRMKVARPAWYLQLVRIAAVKSMAWMPGMADNARSRHAVVIA